MGTKLIVTVVSESMEKMARFFLMLPPPWISKEKKKKKRNSFPLSSSLSPSSAPLLEGTGRWLLVGRDCGRAQQPRACAGVQEPRGAFGGFLFSGRAVGRGLGGALPAPLNTMVTSWEGRRTG